VSLSHLSITNGDMNDQGGGIKNSGTLTLTNCTISGNTSESASGGGIANSGTLTLTNCTIASNTLIGSGGGGGGISNSGTGTLTLSNCTIASNTTAGYQLNGGDIENAGKLSPTNCTISGNSADGNGGGIDNANGSLTARNTIIAGNYRFIYSSGPDLNGVLTSLGHNLIGDDSGASGFMASDLRNVSPLLAPLGSYGGPTKTQALLPGSPAIDAGDDAVTTGTNALTTDQRGYARKSGSHVDIGAYESRGGYSLSISRGNSQVGPLGHTFAQPLQVKLSNSFGEPVAGVVVTFAASTSGASATFGTNPVSIGSARKASTTITATAHPAPTW
jgi:hypothetical protein